MDKTIMPRNAVEPLYADARSARVKAWLEPWRGKFAQAPADAATSQPFHRPAVPAMTGQLVHDMQLPHILVKHLR